MAIFRSVLFLLIMLTGTSSALPSGASNCVGGKAAVGVPHLQGDVTDGSLEEGGILVTIGDQLLMVGKTTPLPIGQDLTWTLNTTKRPFKGFLVRGEDRADDGAVDTTTAFSAQDRKAQVAETVCVNAFNVGGVTHTNNNPKRVVQGIFRMDEAVQELQIDVTIVIKNRKQVSIFYYSGFVVSVGDDELEDDTEENGMEENDPPLIDVESEVGAFDNLEEGENNLLDPERGLPLILRASSCTEESPCGACEGDCNKNSACQEGLECFLRPDATAIPGCVGTGIEGRDYCYKPQNDTLRLRGEDCSVDRPCDRCQGSCETDDVCVGSLSCFTRKDASPVPGCQGSGISGRNYCYEAPSVEGPTLALRSTNCNRTNPCNQCEGECRKDGDCEGDLQCFSRPDLTPVPGCSSSVLGESGRNYCFQPEVKALVLRDTQCSSSLPCNECEGECGDYTQCQGALECLSRSDMEEVPGCTAGGISGKAYCYDSNKGDMVLKPTIPPSSNSTESLMLTVSPTISKPKPRPEQMTKPTNIEEDVETASPTIMPKPERTVRPKPTPTTGPTMIQEEDSFLTTESTPDPTGMGGESGTLSPSPKQTRPPKSSRPTIVVGNMKPPSMGFSLHPTNKPTPMPVPPRPSLRATNMPTILKPSASPSLKMTHFFGGSPVPALDEIFEDGNTAVDLFGGKKALSERTSPCQPDAPCDECEGDCQSDDDCSGILQCFQRPDNTLVPGCNGIGISGTDYCGFNPAVLTTLRPTPSARPVAVRITPLPTPPKPEPTLGTAVNVDDDAVDGVGPVLRDKVGDAGCSTSEQCGECVGNCGSDDDCAGVLRCFFREELEQVPGCSGLGLYGSNYCAFDPNVVVGLDDVNTQVTTGETNTNLMDGNTQITTGDSETIMDGTQITTGDLETNNSPNMLVTRNRVCTPEDPCGKCQGDCDSDEECLGVLQCFFRVEEEPVPGCEGLGVSGRDYCAFNPNARARVRRRIQEEIQQKEP